ncbi:MAG TPA: hypothetical protein VGS27_35770 [Candidatus Sulfotelmatobacter sp.]|nr:hypothetical protein [Candidatus Sulfotelmatobacter sp.]
MNKSILTVLAVLCVAFTFVSCAGGKKSTAHKASGLPERALVSQGVTSATTFGGLVLIDANHDTIAPVAPFPGGNSPGLMEISPSRNIAAAFDAASNSIFAVDTTTETSIGSGSGTKLLGPTTSFVVPTSNQIGFAAVPTATVNGYAFSGAVQSLNFSTGSANVIAVNDAQTVVSNTTGTQLLVFSGDSNSVTVLNPVNAVPPVDTSCYTNPPNSVCTVVPGFDRPVYALVNNDTAYILNCGPQCGGTQASVMVFDLSSLTITKTIPVDAATWGLLNNTTLYVAGTSPTNNACTGQKTAATTCGRLNIIDLNAGKVVGRAVITDGIHQRMDLTVNNQLFIGSRDCTNIGNANNPVGEVRGCLTIYHTDTGAVFFPPDNGNVDGLQGFTTRYIEYVAEGGNLRVYDTIHGDILFIDVFLPQGTIDVVGYVGDVKAIDFF